MQIEVEIRSFITKEKYEELLEYFRSEGEFIKKDNQITYYFNSEQDLRIQKSDFNSKIWLKKGKIHDDQREEIEVHFPTEDFEKLEKIFLNLGYDIDIKWFRKRNAFKWQGCKVALDYTKGYGYIIELEKMSNEEQKNMALEELKMNMKKLNIPLTPKDEFNEKYNYYKENWKELTK